MPPLALNAGLPPYEVVIVQPLPLPEDIPCPLCKAPAGWPCIDWITYEGPLMPHPLRVLTAANPGSAPWPA